MQTHSWIKLVLRLRCRKGGIYYEHLGEPRASTLAVSRPGAVVAPSSPKCDTGAALRLNNYISGNAPEKVPAWQTLAGITGNKLG